MGHAGELLVYITKLCAGLSTQIDAAKRLEIILMGVGEFKGDPSVNIKFLIFFCYLYF